MLKIADGRGRQGCRSSCSAMRASRQQGEVTSTCCGRACTSTSACDAEPTDDLAKQREFLDKALEQDRTNVDVLIALYRATDKEPEKRAAVAKLIKDVIDVCRTQIESAPDEPTYYNQMAWLMANTEGDVDEAIRFSHKSVELARADGEVAQARRRTARYAGALLLRQEGLRQRRQVSDRGRRLDPHTAAISRQLAIFREALAQQPAAGK